MSGWPIRAGHVEFEVFWINPQADTQKAAGHGSMAGLSIFQELRITGVERDHLLSANREGKSHEEHLTCEG